MDVSPPDLARLRRLAHVVQCLRCRSDCRVSASGRLSCVNCDATYTLSDGVLDLTAGLQRPEVIAERAAVAQTERDANLGGINDAFEHLAKAEGELKAAILALPDGNDSRYYQEPGYFLNVKNSQRAFRFVRDRLACVPGQRLLDVGADLTWSTNHFAREGLVCTAIDVNHHLEVGNLFQAHYAVPYDMVRVDMSLPVFRRDAFDVIVAFNALHHGGDLPRLMETLARTLKPGGLLAAVEPYCVSLAQKAAFGRAQIDAGINEHTYMLDEWHAALSDAGLNPVEVMVADACCLIYQKRQPHEGASQQTMLQRAYAGQLTVRRVEVGSLPRQRVVTVDITNHGNTTWCSEGSLPIFAAYHLSRRDGAALALVTFDGPRTSLPDVRPGATISASLVVVLPDPPGEFEVTFDLVQEGLCWFEQQGFIGQSITVGDDIGCPASKIPAKTKRGPNIR